MDHKPLAELASAIKSASTIVEIDAQYLHYKDEHRPYTVTNIVILEDTEEVAVAYHVSATPEVTFIRPLPSWLETVEWQGRTMPRFTKLT